MKILFTGASSFSGMWFIKNLFEAGHSVTATFLRPFESYDGIRRQRVEQVVPLSKPIFGCSFGSDLFLKLIREEKYNLICHHAADVTNYRSPDFEVIPALENNCFNIKNVFKTMMEAGCSQLVLTGSVFEQGEGAGSDGLRAVSPYGLSKGLTSDVFKYYASVFGIRLGKFVIPNPFGPYEEGRFTSYLIQQWMKNQIPPVQFPEYIRDNVPISLLAKAYGSFVSQFAASSFPFVKLNPSGYIESQGTFTERLARQMRPRLSLPCEFTFASQYEFHEPKIRINTIPLCGKTLRWNESEAWDDMALYYSQIYTKFYPL